MNSVSLTSVEGLQKQVGVDGCYDSCCASVEKQRLRLPVGDTALVGHVVST